MIAPPIHLKLNSPDRTARLAEWFAARLRPGDCLLLEGPIGAGKTFFARCMVQSMQDIPEDVPSPTYTLVQIYDTNAGELWHSDLYRVTSPEEVEELGLVDAFDTAICLVEWPDRLGPLAPDTALHMRFSYDPEHEGTRSLTIDWTAPRWGALLQEFGDD